MHFDVLFDYGFDYGASGGQAWDTQINPFPNGRSRRNMRRSDPLGRWELGNRDVDAEYLAYLRDFHHAMRGSAHTFLYKDWNDYEAVDQQLVIDGTATTQLIKSYGLSINAWIRDITKPKPAGVTIEYDSGVGFVALEEGVDFTLDDATGIVTWLLDPLPDAPDVMRWSGEFYVPARFDSDVLPAQFLGAEERADTTEKAYAIGSLPVVEEPDV